tara:strand:- start:243 stop:458 length:216 start_codon:yes stop_codon:yes gene_type:complete
MDNDFKLRANEQFFSSVKNLLKDGGVWTWIDQPDLKFVKNNNKLVSCKKGYKEVSKIVSKKFLIDNFKKEE